MHVRGFLKMLVQNRIAREKKCTLPTSVYHFQVFRYMKMLRLNYMVAHGDEFGFRSLSFSVVDAT